MTNLNKQGLLFASNIFLIGTVTGLLSGYIMFFNYMILISSGIFIEKYFDVYDRIYDIIKNNGSKYYREKLKNLNEQFKVSSDIVDEGQKFTQTDFSFEEMDITKMDINNIRKEIVENITLKKSN